MQRQLALTSVIISALALLGCGGGTATSDESTRDDAGAVVESGDVGALSLQVGDCIGVAVVGQVESVPVVPCSELHDVEVFESFDLSGDTWPGEVGAAELATAGCLAEFEAFIGLVYEESAWEISTIVPSEVSWNATNDRAVLCGVYPATDEDTTGSAKGIAE